MAVPVSYAHRVASRRRSRAEWAAIFAEMRNAYERLQESGGHDEPPLPEFDAAGNPTGRIAAQHYEANEPIGWGSYLWDRLTSPATGRAKKWLRQKMLEDIREPGGPAPVSVERGLEVLADSAARIAFVRFRRMLGKAEGPTRRKAKELIDKVFWPVQNWVDQISIDEKWRKILHEKIQRKFAARLATAQREYDIAARKDRRHTAQEIDAEELIDPTAMSDAMEEELMRRGTL